MIRFRLGSSKIRMNKDFPVQLYLFRESINLDDNLV